MYPQFQAEIAKMNEQYELHPVSQADFAKRLVQFYAIISEEVQETEELIQEAEQQNLDSRDYLRIRVGLADLLADIVVYCASEAERWNIPLGKVLGEAVMPSNFSKLGEDGKPIKNPTTGKFLKGPKYWKPEPMIAKILEEQDRFQTQLGRSVYPHPVISEAGVTPAATSQTAPADSGSR